MTRSLHCCCSSEVPPPLTGNDMLPSITRRLCARLPESMRDTPTQRHKSVKEVQQLSPGRQTETRESNLHRRLTHCVETDRALLTDNRGENREAPLRVVLCRCAFPQFWHVIFRRGKKEAPKMFNIHSQIKGVEWGLCVCVPPQPPRPTLRTNYKRSELSKSRTLCTKVRWACVPSPAFSRSVSRKWKRGREGETPLIGHLSGLWVECARLVMSDLRWLRREGMCVCVRNNNKVAEDKVTRV